MGKIAKEKENVNYCSGLIVTFLWQIWKGGNEAVFSHKTPQPIGTLKKATMLTTEYLSVLQLNKTGSKLENPPSAAWRWRPPPPRILKCNVDRAYFEARQVGAFAAIMRDHQGRALIGKAHRILTMSSLVAEAMAIREDLCFVKSCFCEEILMESDCLGLIEACRNKVPITEVVVLMEDIGNLHGLYRNCGFLSTR